MASTGAVLTSFTFLAAACQQPTATPTITPTPTPTQTAVPLVLLPRDDASHPVNTEWWYYNGHLSSAEGGRYGFHLALFELLIPDTDRYAHIGHFALSDHQEQTYSTSQKIAIRQVDPSNEGFQITCGVESQEVV